MMSARCRSAALRTARSARGNISCSHALSIGSSDEDVGLACTATGWMLDPQPVVTRPASIDHVEVQSWVASRRSWLTTSSAPE